jgi:hypothetical protein
VIPPGESYGRSQGLTGEPAQTEAFATCYHSFLRSPREGPTISWQLLATARMNFANQEFTQKADQAFSTHTRLFIY